MQLKLTPGRYVVAVSGGVDSMVLLNMLAKSLEPRVKSQESRAKSSQPKPKSSQLSAPSTRLIVAHFDHGIRPESAEDRQFVQHVAAELGLPFVFAEGHLGPNASEDLARQARYQFLHSVRLAAGARSILTAHHQDDMLETAIINLLRGTGRRGLSSLRERSGLDRPLLGFTKRQLRAYALSHHLEWREDSTNQDETYLRNYVRLRLLPKFSLAQRQQLLDIVGTAGNTNRALDTQLINYLHLQPERGVLDRQAFIKLPHTIAREVLASWLRLAGLRSFDRKTLERLVVSAKTGRPGSRADIMQGHKLAINAATLALVPNER